MTAQEIRVKALECAVATVATAYQICDREGYNLYPKPEEAKDEALKIAREYAYYIAGND